MGDLDRDYGYPRHHDGSDLVRRLHQPSHQSEAKSSSTPYSVVKVASLLQSYPSLLSIEKQIRDYGSGSERL